MQILKSSFTSAGCYNERKIQPAFTCTKKKGANMKGIRIIELPDLRMATSGQKALEDMTEFNEWWSAVDKKRKDVLFPHDFMYYDEAAKKMVWNYALPPDMEDAGGFDIIDYPGGIYAASVSVDGDDTDGEQVYADIKEWVKSSGAFEPDERPGRYTMFHIITSDNVCDALGYRQLDIYVPIKKK